MPLPISSCYQIFPGKTMHQAMYKIMLYLHRDGQHVISFYSECWFLMACRSLSEANAGEFSYVQPYAAVEGPHAIPVKDRHSGRVGQGP